MIVTAYRDVPKPDGVLLFHKPLDLDHFLGQVEQMLLAEARIELVLYVSGWSPSSLEAMRNLEAVLRRFDVGAVRLEICVEPKED